MPPPTNRPVDLSALSGLAPELAATVASVASDIALVIDTDGVIRNVAQGGGAPLAPAAVGWIGRPWADTVTAQTRRKVEQLVQEALAAGVARQREVNHPSSDAGGEVPVAYAAVRLGAGGPLLAVGRDLRAVAAIQQRFVEAQQELERDYWQRRQTEERYQLLFQVATDAVLVADAASLAVLDANAAAATLFELSRENLIGKSVAVGIDRASRPAVDELLSTARASGRPSELRVRLAGQGRVVGLSATPLRAGGSMLLLVRVRPLAAREARVEAGARLIDLVERMPEAVVVADSGGRVLIGNPAFASLLRLPGAAQAQGRPLADWLGADGELAELLAQARHHGIAVGRVALRGRDGVQVDLSAALLPEGEQECVGFTLRPVAVGGTAADAALAATLGRLDQQLGASNLPALLREAADAAERHFIAAALERCGNQLARAAELLGISAESLALRIHRLGLPEPGH